MYPPGRLTRLPFSGPTTRDYTGKPLLPGPRSSQQQSRDYAAYSGNYRDNRTCGRTSTLSYTSSADSARRSDGSPTEAAQKLKNDRVNGAVHTLSESENILDNTAKSSNGTIANQAIFHDQWKRIGFIGKGSYGEVYRALDITTGYIFAVKEVNSKVKRRTLVQALQDERETLKELEHPNIVRYLGFGENQEVLNIFLEYVPGGTIRSCLNTHGRFKETVTKCFTSQILRGLSYLHSKSILHRDLKSENILVEPEGICKISDFGISKKTLETNRGRLYSTLKGTVAYMAPEMVDDEKKGYDSKIDIWSVGCIVFEMWTGKTPWSGRKDVQILMKLFIEKLAPPLPDDISLSATAENFRREFFHIDPEKRPSAVKLLEHEYLNLPPQWVFPGVDEMGQAPDICSKFISQAQMIWTPPPHSDDGTGTGLSPFQDIYSDIEEIAAENNLSTAINAPRSLSLARTMYSDVMDPRLPSPPLISLTPPLRPRKEHNFHDNYTTTSPNASSPKPPYCQLTVHNADPDNKARDSQVTSLACSGRRPYVYQPPLFPELNILIPYSRTLVPPTTIRYSKPISQALKKPVNLSKPVPTKLLVNHGIPTTLSTDVSSVRSSAACSKVDCSAGQRGASYKPSENDDDDDDDDDERYSPSAWNKPPVDIPLIRHHHRALPSAIPRPSVETVYKGFLSKSVENIDLPDADVAVARSSTSSKKRYTMQSIREVVEERLHQVQIGPAQSPQRSHFWNSHMEEVEA